LQIPHIALEFSLLGAGTVHAESCWDFCQGCFSLCWWCYGNGGDLQGLQYCTALIKRAA